MSRTAMNPAKAALTKTLRREAGRWLKTAREAAGLTQAELAEKTGLRYYTFVSQVENGLGRVPIEAQARDRWRDRITAAISNITPDESGWTIIHTIRFGIAGALSL